MSHREATVFLSISPWRVHHKTVAVISYVGYASLTMRARYVNGALKNGRS